MKYIVNL